MPANLVMPKISAPTNPPNNGQDIFPKKVLRKWPPGLKTKPQNQPGRLYKMLGKMISRPKPENFTEEKANTAAHCVELLFMGFLLACQSNASTLLQNFLLALPEGSPLSHITYVLDFPKKHSSLWMHIAHALFQKYILVNENRFLCLCTWAAAQYSTRASCHQNIHTPCCCL